MATQSKKKTNAAPEEKIENALDKTESFFEKNIKMLLTILLVAVLIVGGYFAYEYLAYRPKMEKASEMMFVAEQYFMEGDYELALNGDFGSAGFVEVVDKYGSTRQGKLAAHYAGICCMQMGDFDAAMDYLTKYKTVKGAPGAIVNAQNYGLQGDIYVEKGEYGKALEMYRKAIDVSDNVLTAPYYLRKLALVYDQQGMYQDAIDACERVKTDYSDSLEARDIDKLIGEFEQKL